VQAVRVGDDDDALVAWFQRRGVGRGGPMRRWRPTSLQLRGVRTGGSGRHGVERDERNQM